MSVDRTVFCVKLQTQASGLSFRPYPGPLGQRIYQSISQQAWQQWVDHQTVLINEYRLSTLEPQAREFLVKEMEKFLFGDGPYDIPTAFTPTT